MRCIDFKELRTIIPYCRAHIARLEALPPEKDPFPKRVNLGKCRVCWMLDEVLAWLQRRIDRR
jgi:prophage regulatory protein